jgi:hypothetical protein
MMSKKTLRINLEGLEGGHRNQALWFADCIRGSGNLIGIFGSMIIRAPKSYSESFRGNCMVELLDIPLDDVKVNGWSALGIEIKTDIMKRPAYEMDNFEMTDIMERLFNDDSCKLDTSYLPTGVTLIEED